MTEPLLAFVSAPGGSRFMEELLDGVIDAVEGAGGRATHARGFLDEVLGDPGVVAVIVPHEYVALDPDVPAALLARTIGFGVEHPGTTTFEAAAAVMPALGGAVEIGPEAVTEMNRRGVPARHFKLGWSPRWRQPDLGDERPVHLVHLGTADQARLAQLAPMAAQWADLRTHLLLAPHEPMTATRPDFVIGTAKDELLRRSRLLVNLHREGATAFEWVRALDAIRNGCVVLTTPSRGLDPLVPGEDVLVAEPNRLALVARAALCDPDGLRALAAKAWDLCRAELNMVRSAEVLLEMAADVRARAAASSTPAFRPETARPRPAGGRAEPPMAVWVPEVRALPTPGAPRHDRARRTVRALHRAQAGLEHPPVSPRITTVGRGPARVDVVCVARPGDGPVGATFASIEAAGVDAAIRVYDDADVGPDGRPARPLGRGAARNALLADGRAPFVLVLDAGDEVLDTVLAELVARLDADPSLELVYPMAVLGSSMVVNALVPEARRLRRHAYLTRGYLARRRLLARLGGFTDDVAVEGWVDHDLWTRATNAGAAAQLVPRVGIRLWEQSPDLTIGDVDPEATLTVLAGSQLGRAGAVAAP